MSGQSNNDYAISMQDVKQAAKDLEVHGDMNMMSGAGNPSSAVGVARSTHDNISLSALPVFEGYGHIIQMDDDSMECLECGMEVEVPDIFTKSSGFYQVIYKMYIMGQFKHSDCDDDPLAGELVENDNSVIHDNTTNISYDSNNIHWMTDGQGTINIEGVTYQVNPDGTLVNLSNGEKKDPSATVSVDELSEKQKKKFKNRAERVNR